MKSRGLSKIEKIYRDGLCLGCGLCQSLCSSDSLSFGLDQNGFYQPKIITLSKEKDDLVDKICPAKNVVIDKQLARDENIWGRIESLSSVFSRDEEIRQHGSSGGVISGLAIFFLESNVVDAVLQVGGDPDDMYSNKLKISKSRAEVLQCASSRYAPALVLNSILEILRSTEDVFCFIGKPCDVSGIRNLLIAYPEYQNRIKVCIALVCAGMPSFRGTENVISSFGLKSPVRKLRYRGGGWPGYFSFEDLKGKNYQMSYNDSWGKILGRTMHPRCKICPDGIGMQADIAVGDAWDTKDGYPDFSEKPGKSLVLCRTVIGENLFRKAVASGNLTVAQAIDKKSLKKIQPYQWRRRKYVYARLLAYRAVRRVSVRFSGTGVLQNALFANPFYFAKEFVGALRRAIKQTI